MGTGLYEDFWVPDGGEEGMGKTGKARRAIWPPPISGAVILLHIVYVDFLQKFSYRNRVLSNWKKRFINKQKNRCFSFIGRKTKMSGMLNPLAILTHGQAKSRNLNSKQSETLFPAPSCPDAQGAQ